MTYIRKDYSITSSHATDSMCFSLLGTAGAAYGAYAYQVDLGKSYTSIAQVAFAGLGFGAAYDMCRRCKKLKENRVDRFIDNQVDRVRHPSEEKIQAAWRRFQALPWYPEILREVQFPPADIIESEQEKNWEWTRASGAATDEEARLGISRDNFKGGNCDGITNAIVHALIANPYSSELQVLSSIDGKDITYYQLISNCLRDTWKTSHDEANLTSKKVSASFKEVKPKIWESSRKSYEYMPISDELKPYIQYVQEILKDKPSSKSVIIGKFFLFPGHVMGFEIFPNDEWRIFENGRPIYGNTIETFAVALKELSRDHERVNRMQIIAVFV